MSPARSSRVRWSISKFVGFSRPVASRSISCQRPGGRESPRMTSRDSTPSSIDQTSGRFQSTGAPTLTGQPRLALRSPAARTASQSVGTRIAAVSQYQRPVWPPDSKGLL